MTAKALRQSVLRCAMQGKLVPHDSSDEPAAVLLERVRIAKSQLTKSGKIKKEKQPSSICRAEDGSFIEMISGKNSVCLDDEIPFDIPESWEWVRFKDLVRYQMGKTPARQEKKFWNHPQYSWVSIADMNALGFIDSTKEQVSQVAYNDIFKGNISPAGTLLMSFKLTIGKVSILNIPAFHNEAIISIFPLIDDGNIMRNFLFYILPYISQMGETKAAIKGNTLNSSSIDMLLIPLPPLAEQKRIVDRLNEINPLLDEYERLEKESSKMDGEICDKLRNSILQYAMQGKLVPQDSSDEPASVLLEKITREGQKKLGKGYVTSRIYKGTDDKTYEKIGEKVGDLTNEVPFDIPDTWSWVRLRDIAELNPKNKVDDNLDAGFIPMASLVGGYRSEYSYEVKKWKSIKNGFTHFSEGDVVVAKITPCLQNRKSAIIHSLPNGIGAGTTELHVVRPLYDDMCREYLLWIFKSSYFIDSAAKSVSGTAGQQRVGKEFMSKFLIPLPPLAEQQRIAKALDKAFAEIDALETAIKNSDLA